MHAVARGLGLSVMLFAGFASAQTLINVTDDSAPEEYVVEAGDTLWDICQEFFEDPWMWPTVWALNPHVTNPHWIYPGDILRLRVPEAVAKGEALPTLTYIVGSQEASQLSRNAGFIADQPIESLGLVHRAPESRVHLGDRDIVYLKMNDLDSVRPGQRFSVYRVLNDVVRPEDDENGAEVIGQKIKVLGVVQVSEVDEHYARATVSISFEELLRGDQLMPERPHNVRVSPKQNLIDLEGRVVDHLTEFQNAGQLNVVFIDRGSKDGVQVGNRLFIVRQFDGALELEDDETARLPQEQIGELMVVDTQDRTATALVTRAAREIFRGDRLVMERHY